MPKGRARRTSLDFIGSWPPNEAKRFFFIRNNFEYVDGGGEFSNVVVNEKPMDAQSRDPYVLKDKMMDAGIPRKQVPRHFQNAAENGEFEKVVTAMTKDGILDHKMSFLDAEVSSEMPSGLGASETKNIQAYELEDYLDWWVYVGNDLGKILFVNEQEGKGEISIAVKTENETKVLTYKVEDPTRIQVFRNPEDAMQNKQPDLFSTDEMRRTRRPWGHWKSWYGRRTIKHEGYDERLAKIQEAVEAWEWEDSTPEQFASALREAGADPQFVDLGSIGKYIVADETVYDVESPDSGESVSNFVWGLYDYTLQQYAEEHNISSSGGWDEIGHGEVVYHCTDAENVPSIMENGIDTQNKTRALSNRGTGAAVFMSYEPASAEFYGNACFEIAIGAMKDAGVMPELQQEDPIVEAKIRGAIAWKLGDHSNSWGESELAGEGIEENTLVMFGGIPPQFIKLYSGPDELMEQYAAGAGAVKTAVDESDIEDYTMELQEQYGTLENLEDINPEEELEDEDWTGSNLYDILHDVFEWSGKIALWKTRQNPADLLRIEKLEPRMERYADLAITFVKTKMHEWLQNHDDWDR